MIRMIRDQKYGFTSVFNDVTGEYLRGTNCEEDPFMAEFPHLIDVGIMGSCVHGRSGLCAEAGIGCYQNGLGQCQPDMTLDNYKWIVDQCRGRTFEIALGGRGDPDMHPDFEEILKYTRQEGIVPNFTTSGLGMTPEKAKLCKKYCGAVAVSWYSRLGRENGYTEQAIRMLLEAEVTTNIHYVLSNSTIDEALIRLREGLFPKGINAVVFLLHKPVGQGTEADVLKVEDPRVKEFFVLADGGTFPFQIGFDSCSIPGILRWGSHTDTASIDTCEGARFSMYIGVDLMALPCSFDHQKQRFGIQLTGRRETGVTTMEDAWNSDAFSRFREGLAKRCPGCPRRELCMGGCPLERNIILCHEPQRTA